MPPKQGTVPIDVIEIDSSDDEAGIGKTSNTSSNEPPLPNELSFGTFATVSSSHSSYRPLESRSFWKAGDYEVSPSKFVASQGQLEHARVNPKFLHSNATSHKWVFGAIAELLDNAVDEIQHGATCVKLDRIYNSRDNSPALMFQDDGGGMSPECIRKCMSLGYSSKNTNTTIGQYGNGFKTSTMRLGADVIVFSRSSHEGLATQSVGLLSYTFLRRTGQDDVIVPMVDFDISDHWAEPIIYSTKDDWSANLKTILEWSPFASKDELMLQFEGIGLRGTKIIIYNLWMNDEGIFELNFDDDEEDVRLRDEANRGGLSRVNKKVAALQSHISYRIRYSLRAYVSMLYLRKFSNFKIIIRGKPVEQFNIADELKHSEVTTYRPQLAATSKEVAVVTTVGFIKEAPAVGVSGFNVYHKNRLIRPFWKVTADGGSQGNGIVGVLEANFIEPAHDKQDFERSILFFRLEAKLKQMVMDYWRRRCHLIGYQPLNHSVRNIQNTSSTLLQDNIQARVQLQPATTGLGTHPTQDFSGAKQDRQNQSPIVPIIVDLEAIESPLMIEDGHTIVITALWETAKEISSTDISRSINMEQLCEENIQLFMRCEEYNAEENELKQTVEELEKEIEETKRKCVELSLQLENQRKNKVVKLQPARN